MVQVLCALQPPLALAEFGHRYPLDRDEKSPDEIAVLFVGDAGHVEGFFYDVKKKGHPPGPDFAHSIIVPDVGILASTDPVAVDKAAIDMVEARGGRTLPELIGRRKLDWHDQIEHAVKVGLGQADYELIKVT